jgi:acyl-CoA thioester hydrolase
MLRGFRFVHPVAVRFRDLDALGHVNNAVFLTYLESARLAYWLQVTGRTDLRGMDVILARAEVDYRAPVGYGAELEVGVRCASIRRSSLVLEQRIVEQKGEPGGRLVAEARKVLVYYDYAAARPQAVPEDLRQRLLAQDPELSLEV